MIDMRFRPMLVRVNPTGDYRKSPFETSREVVFSALERELEALGATDIIVEAGFERHQIRNDGWPVRGVTPSHSDVRLFFSSSRHGPLVYECAKFSNHLANLRAIDEWGIGKRGEAYRGFAALPEKAGADDALELIFRLAGFAIPADGDVVSYEEIRSAFRVAAKRCHPDNGGSAADMAALTRAMAALTRAVVGGPIAEVA